MSNRIDQMSQGLLGKIAENSSGGAKKIAGAGAAQATRDTGSAPADGARSSGDTVELTSSAQLLERLERTLASLPEIDRARVDAVKSAIADGEYEIDAGRIADALLLSERRPG